MAQARTVFSEEEQRYSDTVDFPATWQARKGLGDHTKQYVRRKEEIRICFDKWKANLASNQVERLHFKVEYFLSSGKQGVYK